MLKIFLAELDYSSRSLLLALVLMLSFTMAVLTDIPFINEENEFSKVFWPIISGVGPIFIIAKSLIMRVKDGKYRLFITLPIKPQDVSRADRIYGGMLAFTVLLYFVIIHLYLLNDWGAITKRLIYNIGIYLIIFSSVKVAYEMMVTVRFENSTSFILAAVVFIFFVLLSVFISDMILFPILHQSYIGIIYSVIGLGIFYAGTRMFNNRHDFTK